MADDDGTDDLRDRDGDAGGTGDAENASRSVESGRVEAFSDGVFAIALTLLVLDLHSPDHARGHFAEALGAQWPAYLAYFAAFLNIAAIWVNHHDLFARVRQVDLPLICINLVLLLVTSLFPWPASVISSAVREGTRADEIAASLLYAGVGLAVPLAWIGLYGYLARPSVAARLLKEPRHAGYARDGVRRSSVSLVVYPVAAALAFVEPVLTLAAFVVLPVFFIGSLLQGQPEARSRGRER